MMEFFHAPTIRAYWIRGAAFLILLVLILNAGCGWRPKIKGPTEGGIQRNF